MLEVRSLVVSYDGLQVLWDVSLEVRSGEIVSLLGPNGAGKSSLVNAISGLVPSASGHILLEGTDLTQWPTHRRVEHGIGHVLERRRLFPHMTVRENLLLGGFSHRGRRVREASLYRVFTLFPILARRQEQLARSLSGGEQQMCAIARGLMSDPRLLIVDEPLLGLAPSVVADLAGVFRRLRDDGMSVLFVEQNVEQALRCADRAYILETGRIVLAGAASALLVSDQVKSVYLGL